MFSPAAKGNRVLSTSGSVACPPIPEPLLEIALFLDGREPSRLPFRSGERGMDVRSEKQRGLRSEKEPQAQGVRCSRVMMAWGRSGFKKGNYYVYILR